MNKKQNKNAAIVIRCTEAYKRLVADKARRLGYSTLSRYVRSCIVAGSERETVLDLLDSVEYAIGTSDSQFSQGARFAIDEVREAVKRLDI